MPFNVHIFYIFVDRLQPLRGFSHGQRMQSMCVHVLRLDELLDCGLPVFAARSTPGSVSHIHVYMLALVSNTIHPAVQIDGILIACMFDLHLILAKLMSRVTTAAAALTLNLNDNS